MAKTHERFSILIVSLRFPPKAEPKTRVCLASSLFWKRSQGTRMGDWEESNEGILSHRSLLWTARLNHTVASKVLYTVASEFPLKGLKKKAVLQFLFPFGYGWQHGINPAEI